MNLKSTLCCTLASLSLGAVNNGHADEKQLPPTEPKKILVAYYSRGGNTRHAAEQIQKTTGGILFEIKPSKAYPEEYEACVEQVKKEIAEGHKPELSSKVDKIAQYDVIFVGTPNWWSTLAPPVATFLSSYNLEGKTIIPFVTHGGGGMARCETDMKKLLPKSTFLKGKAFAGRDIKKMNEDIAKWARETVAIKK